MSIFKRSSAEVQQATGTSATATDPGQPPANAIPPASAASPGVVPPPAAPIYSTRPPEAADGSVQERMKAARDAQQSAQERIRIAVQRARSSTAAAGARGRQAQQPGSMTSAAGARPPINARQPFDALACAQTGLLNLAWRWQEAGAPIRAIHAYMALLQRYPESAAAGAAVADLVQLSEKLAGEGQFHTALGIYEQLEQLP
jgi:hypothetical protein